MFPRLTTWRREGAMRGVMALRSPAAQEEHPSAAPAGLRRSAEASNTSTPELMKQTDGALPSVF